MRGRAALAAAAVTVTTLALAVPPAGAVPAERSFEVAITNLTSGQPLTPPVLATHRGAYDAFDVGSPAGVGVQQIAENGNSGPLMDELTASRHVSDFLESGMGPLVPDGTPGAGMFDDSVTLEITAGPGAKFLTWVSMLICTNDGFTGVDRARLPNQVGATVSWATFAYDAGTEVNTEDLADMVPPCQGLIGVADDGGDPGTGTSDPTLAEGGVIHHHGGIVGGADLLPGTHGWDTSTPVAEISVTRTA